MSGFPRDGGGGLHIARERIDAAALSTLFSDPVQLIAAPGAGLAIAIVQMMAATVPVLGNFNPNNGPPTPYYAGAVAGGKEASSWDSVPDFLSNGSGNPALSQLCLSSPSSGTGKWATPTYEDTPVVFAADVGNPTRIGGLLAATVNDGGTLYAPGDTGTIDVVNFVGGAAYEIDTVDVGGAVLTFHITAPGEGYEGATNWATTPGGAQPGIGTGFTVDIDDATGIDVEGELILTTAYLIVPID